jgi:tRNA threonylcarbamoyladenosine modification (KEOPS) complex Cgi121 subunit
VLRNLILCLLRLTGHDNIARALRRQARHGEQVIAVLHLHDFAMTLG